MQAAGLRQRRSAADGSNDASARAPAAAARAAEGDSLFDESRLGLFLSCLLLVYGVASLAVYGEKLLYLAGLAPMLAAPHLVVALLTIGLGVAGLVLNARAGRPRQAEKARVPELLTLEQLLAATHEYAAPLPAGVVVEAQHHEHYTRAICGQIGPVCAAASVSGALNVLNGLQPGPGAFRVRVSRLRS